MNYEQSGLAGDLIPPLSRGGEKGNFVQAGGEVSAEPRRSTMSGFPSFTPGCACQGASKNVDEANSDFRFIITPGDRAGFDVTAKAFVKHFTENLPVLAQVIAIVDVETK